MQISCIQTASAARSASRAAAAVSSLVSQGTAPQAILILAATQNHKASFLAAHTQSEGLRVRTFDELTQDVLACNGAAASLGRSARVLLPSEEKVLLEDLKVSGLKVHRLREMMKFFFRGLTEGKDAEEGWLINNEERSLLAFAMDHLKEMGAILACERSNLALKCLEVAGVLATVAADHVVVCGFTSLDKCGQELARKLAKRSLTCIGHPADDGCEAIAYPYTQGFKELVESGAAFEDADASAGDALDNLRTRVGIRIDLETPLPDAKTRESWKPNGREDQAITVFTTPEEELAAFAGRVRSLIDASVDPSNILVVSPNVGYTKSACEQLTKAGVPAWAHIAPAYVKGDPRKVDAGALKFLCALNLVADPTDAVAWRTWLGMGDWLLRSDAWEILRKISGQQGVSMVEAIDLVRRCSDPASGMELGPQALGALKLIGPIHEADKLLQACKGLSGKALLAQIEVFVGWKMGHAERVILQGCPGSATAILERLRKAVLDPAVPSGTVVVGQSENLRGLHARNLFLVGTVSGYFPCYQAVDEDETHDKRRARALVERRKLLMTLGLADANVSFTAFSESDLEFADRSKVDIGRIFVRGGKRLATAKTSAFLVECDQEG